MIKINTNTQKTQYIEEIDYVQLKKCLGESIVMIGGNKYISIYCSEFPSLYHDDQNCEILDFLTFLNVNFDKDLTYISGHVVIKKEGEGKISRKEYKIINSIYNQWKIK